MIMDAAEIARLREINKKATPGDWGVYSESVTRDEAKMELTYQVDHTEPFVGSIFLLNAGGKCPATTGVGPTSEANAAYIAAFDPPTTRALIDALEQAQKELAGAREEIEGWQDMWKDFDKTAIDPATLRDERDTARQFAKDARALAYEECAKVGRE